MTLREGVVLRPFAEAAAMEKRIGECCWFCLKTKKAVLKLVVSDATGARICDECVALCVELMERGENCAACGHEHMGADLAFVCVGCPCPERPGAR